LKFLKKGPAIRTDSGYNLYHQKRSGFSLGLFFNSLSFLLLTASPVYFLYIHPKRQSLFGNMAIKEDYFSFDYEVYTEGAQSILGTVTILLT
jgi:hypothetical protein